VNIITNRQIFFIIFLTLTSYSRIDIPKQMVQSMGRSGWIMLIAAALVFGIAAAIIAKLNNMFRGKMFIDYSREISGKFFTALIAIYFILYFFSVGVFLKLKFAGLIMSNFLPKTPQFVILFIAIALYAYVSYKGITNIARMLEIFGIMLLIVSVGINIMMLFQGMGVNVLPFFNINEAKKLLSSSKYLITPFGGLEVLLVIPFTKINKKAPKTAFLTVLFVGLFYVLIVESTLMTLGINNTMTLNDSLIEAIKLVDTPVIERTDVLYLTFGLTGLFAGMITVFTAITEIICNIFKNANRKITVTVIGAAFYVSVLAALKVKNFNDIYGGIAPYLIIISTFIIPITLFIMAKIKKRAAKNN